MTKKNLTALFGALLVAVLLLSPPAKAQNAPSATINLSDIVVDQSAAAPITLQDASATALASAVSGTNEAVTTAANIGNSVTATVDVLAGVDTTTGFTGNSFANVTQAVNVVTQQAVSDATSNASGATTSSLATANGVNVGNSAAFTITVR